jgi:hypothetical protein
MGKRDDELERLKRIRDQQIEARDPFAKGRALHRRLSARQRRMRKQKTLQEIMQEMLADIPARWKGTVIGATIGTLISIVLVLLKVDAVWVILTWLVVSIFLAIGGFIIGRAFDWRDEVRDEL